ncbi:hypothetical protein YC2023_053835 [Brassica napus]
MLITFFTAIEFGALRHVITTLVATSTYRKHKSNSFLMVLRFRRRGIFFGSNGLTKGSLMLLHQEVWVQTPENANYADYGEKWLQEVFNMVQDAPSNIDLIGRFRDSWDSPAVLDELGECELESGSYRQNENRTRTRQKNQSSPQTKPRTPSIVSR